MPARSGTPWLAAQRNTRRPPRLLTAPSAVTTTAKSKTKYRKLWLLTATSNNPTVMSHKTQEGARERAMGPLRAQPNSVLARIIHMLYILATVFLLGSNGSAAQGEGAATGNGTAITAISRIPFLHGERGVVDAAQPQEPRWVRVFSAKAAHPAMYVPADGIVYCPIAKVSAFAVAVAVATIRVETATKSPTRSSSSVPTTTTTTVVLYCCAVVL